MRKILRFFVKFIARACVCRYCDGGEIDGGGLTASHSTQGRTEEGRRGMRGRRWRREEGIGGCAGGWMK